jgi:hypothetical protein
MRPAATAGIATAAPQVGAAPRPAAPVAGAEIARVALAVNAQVGGLKQGRAFLVPRRFGSVASYALGPQVDRHVLLHIVGLAANHEH